MSDQNRRALLSRTRPALAFLAVLAILGFLAAQNPPPPLQVMTSNPVVIDGKPVRLQLLLPQGWIERGISVRNRTSAFPVFYAEPEQEKYPWLPAPLRWLVSRPDPYSSLTVFRDTKPPFMNRPCSGSTKVTFNRGGISGSFRHSACKLAVSGGFRIEYQRSDERAFFATHVKITDSFQTLP
jgi:hypothetical protein